MKRLLSVHGSSLGDHVFLRITRPTFDGLRRHLAQDPDVEQFAFALYTEARTAAGTALIVQDLFLPGCDDLQQQSAASVIPAKRFQAMVYLLAQQRGHGILDIHTHCHPGAPVFSPVDESGTARNARCICKMLAAPAPTASLVFSNNLTAHDAVVYDRSLGGYRTIDWIDVLGRRIEVRRTAEPAAHRQADDPQFARQTLIPGWDQATLARQRVAVVGAGGNGAQLIQTLVSIGVGTDGWIAAVDHDLIEASNLPRIPYAAPHHVGHPKVTVAAAFAHRKNPAVRFYPYPCSVTEQAAVTRIKEATVIFGAGDGDGVRKFLNEIAVRHLIPYIDLGCGISAENDQVSAAGQVHVVFPGLNACLACCQAFDPSVAALELMDDETKAAHASRGYVVGAQAEATPSVANLNATVAQLGIAALLALVHGEAFGRWDYAHFNQLTAGVLTARSATKNGCPVCGPRGVLGIGDGRDYRLDTAQPGTQPPAARVEKTR